jgi:hypothetical protein
MTITNRPADVPAWATDTNYTSGLQSGSATKIVPLTGDKAQGHLPATRDPAQKMNWNQNVYGKWIDYVADIRALNWHPTVNGLATLDTGYIRYLEYTNNGLRGNGTQGAKCIPLLLSTGWWIVTGAGAQGQYFIGDHAVLASASASAGGDRKYTFGVEAPNGTVMLFDSTNGTGVASLAYSKSPAAEAFDLTSTGWSDHNLGHLAAASHYVCNDAITTSAGNVVVCGGLAGALYVWTSPDNGTTFTPNFVHAAVNGTTSYLDRVMEGASGRLFAFYTAGILNGGDALYYSDDQGATWTQVPSLGYDFITDIVYSAELGLYAIGTPSEVIVTTDPTTGIGGGTVISGGGNTLVSMANHGPEILFIYTNTIGVFVAVTSDMFTTVRNVARQVFPFAYIGASADGQFAMQGPSAVGVPGSFRASLMLSGAGRG